jgi:hypothetical protein
MFLSMSYDPRDHLVASSDVTVGIGLSGALLACLMAFGSMGPASSAPDGTYLAATSVATPVELHLLHRMRATKIWIRGTCGSRPWTQTCPAQKKL